MSRASFAVTRRGFLAGSASMLAGASLAAGAAPAGAQLRAGAATVKITPPLGASIDGVIARGGPARQVHDELHVRCLVLDDGRTRLALAVCDLRMIARSILDRAKSLLPPSINLPADHVLISATHTHAAAGTIGQAATEIDRAYQSELPRRIAEAIQQAAANLAPARIGWGSVDRPEFVFNRRWHMKPGSIPANPFGEKTDRVQMNPPAGSPNLVEPAGPVDPQLSVVSVRRVDGTPLAVFGNYGVHYIGGYEAQHISADYYGRFSERVVELLATGRASPAPVGMMSNGTSGDVNSIDPRHPRPAAEPWTRLREVADDLAASAAKVCRQIEYHDQIALSVATTEIELGVRRPTPERLEWAKKTLAGAKEGKRLTRPEIYAGEALQLAAFPAKVPVLLQAMRIGSLGVAAIPCEVFAETGLAIKPASPLKPTIVVELANAYHGYLPTPRQHELGSYETWPARSAYLEREAEPQIRESVLGLLKRVAASNC